MKKQILISFLMVASVASYAQVSTSLPFSPLGGSAKGEKSVLVPPQSPVGGKTEGLGESLYTLQQLKDSALQNNITIRSAQHNIEAAKEQRKEAFTKYFPNVSGTGLWFNANRGMAKMDIDPSGMISPELGASLAQIFPAEALATLGSPISMSMMKNGTIASITAMQPIFAGGQIANGNRLARLGEDVSQLQLQLSENEVERVVEQYYWQIVTLQEKLKTNAAITAMLTDIQKDVDVAVKAGVALRNDLLQVQLRLNEVESQRVTLQNNIDIVRMTLAQYCGLMSEEFRVESQIDGLTDSAMPSLQSSLETLPEYQLLQKQVDAANLQKQIAIGQQLPTVAIGAGYNYHNLLENDRTFGMVFATVSIPISDWWGGSHAIRRKKIEYRHTLEEQQDKIQLLNIRIRKAWNNVYESHQQLDIAQRSVEQAEENLRLNRDYYRAGTTKMSDLLEAQMHYQLALDRRTDAFANYQNRLLEYHHATGTK